MSSDHPTGKGENDALAGAPVCAQLEFSWGVFDPVSRGPRSAPIIDRLCACIHNTPSTFLGVGDGGGSGLHHLI